jgi:hypothetical protein
MLCGVRLLACQRLDVWLEYPRITAKHPESRRSQPASVTTHNNDVGSGAVGSDLEASNLIPSHKLSPHKRSNRHANIRNLDTSAKTFAHTQHTQAAYKQAKRQLDRKRKVALNRAPHPRDANQ